MEEQQQKGDWQKVNAVNYSLNGRFVREGARVTVCDLATSQVLNIHAPKKTCYGWILGCSRKIPFPKKIRLPLHVPLWGIYNPDPKAFFVWTSLGGHTT